MTDTQLKSLKNRIESSFKKFTDTKSHKVIPTNLTLGKIYEAYILSKLVNDLVQKEKLIVRLVNANSLKLKSSPGKIDRNNPHFDLYRSQSDYNEGEHKKFGEIWTDVEFISLSYSISKRKSAPTKGEYHELDLLVTKPGVVERPRHDEIYLGVECKNTSYSKKLLREILGVRRELSFYIQGKRKTEFNAWPSREVKVDHPSCLLVYSTDPKIHLYQQAGDTFSIEFIHEPIR